MKKNDGFRIVFGTPKDFLEKDRITKRCLEIANAAKFPTDYADMYEHLFTNEDAELFMVMDKNDEIYGFATCDNIAEYSNTYLHGIIIHPDIQGMGFSVKLLSEIIKKDGNRYFSARTHNPRIYEAMSRIAYKGIIFPQTDSENIPKEIWNVIWSHSAMKDADRYMVVRNAYPDEKVIQSVVNADIHKIFSKLNPKDAQVVVVCTKNPNNG